MLIIIIPCYNEYNRIPKDKFIHFLNNNNDVKLVFSNDGSTDNTIHALRKIQYFAKDRVFIHSLKTNKGKAKAVREGVLFCFQNDFKYTKIAYLDADLATSLEECVAISNTINGTIIFAFGSRISKIDNTITRKLYRHLTGRFIATIISHILGIRVYDTQCGCKVLNGNLAEKVFKEEFKSKWLFDVEIFYRIIQLYGREKMKSICKEVPLKCWTNSGNSKVKFTYFFKLWFDIIVLRRKYAERK
jgi:dolichyl-phosphate beta-glucosyltransferase